MAWYRVCVSERVQGRHWTCGVLLVAAIVALLLPLFVSTTVCSTSTRYSSQVADYAHEVCAFSNAFYRLDLSGESYNFGSMEGHTIPATTWSPCLLLLMALAIHLPYVIWSQLNDIFGTDLICIVNALAKERYQEPTQHTPKEKESNSKRLMKYVLMAFKAGRNSITSILLLGRKVAIILFTLIVFLVIQLVANPFKVNILTDISMSREDPLGYYSTCRATYKRDTENMPCVHPANLVLRQVYVVVSVFLLAVFLLDIADLVLWVARLFSPCLRDAKIAASIQDMESQQRDEGDNPTGQDPVVLEQQFAAFLGCDGFLLLSLAQHVAGHQVWEELVLSLWLQYKASRPLQQVTVAQEEKTEGTSEGEVKKALLPDEEGGQPSPQSGQEKPTCEKAEFKEEKEG